MPITHSSILSRHAPSAQPGDRPLGYVHKSATIQPQSTAVTLREDVAARGWTTPELIHSTSVSPETNVNAALKTCATCEYFDAGDCLNAATERPATRAEFVACGLYFNIDDVERGL